MDGCVNRRHSAINVDVNRDSIQATVTQLHNCTVYNIEYLPITTCSLLFLVIHKNRLQPSRRMDNPGCSCFFCHPKIEVEALAKSNFAFMFDNWPFHRRSVLVPSQQSFLSQIARYLQTRFPHASFIPLFKLLVSDIFFPL